MKDSEVIERAIAQVVSGKRAPAQLLGVAPAVVNGLYAMGLDAHERGRHVAADNCFQRCVLLEPFRADFWLALGASRQALGRPGDAGEIYQVAALVGGDNAPVAYAAACFAQAGQLDRARVLAEHVRRAEPDTSRMDGWLAVVDAAAGLEVVS